MRTSSFIQRVFVLLLLFIFATGLEGQDASYTKFGNFLFKVPNGWNPVEKENAMLLLAPEPRPT